MDWPRLVWTSHIVTQPKTYMGTLLILLFEFELRSERDKIPLWSQKQILILVNMDNEAYKQYWHGGEQVRD